MLGQQRSKRKEATDVEQFEGVLGQFGENHPLGANQIGGIFDLDGPEEDVPMENGEGNFDSRTYLVAIMRFVKKQDVQLSKKMWANLVSFVGKTKFDRRVKQIGVEIIFVVSKVSAEEFYFWYTKSTQLGSKHEISTTYEMHLTGVLRELLDMKNGDNWFVRLKDDDQMKIWMVNAAKQLHVVAKIIDTMAKVGLDANEEQIHDIIDSTKIYTFPHLSGLCGVNVRDGFAVFPDSLPGSATKSDTFRANLIVLAIHEFAHHIARKLTNNFGYSTPTTIVRKGQTVPRLDAAYSGITKGMELGRVMEMSLFGGYPGGMEVDWGRTWPDGVENFLNRMNKNLPFYSSREECFNAGLVESQTPCISFSVKV